MRWTRLFIPTLRETPAEAESASHQFLLRAGYIRQLAAGIYSYLPLAQRSMQRIIRIVREEMDAIGAQEILLPALNPADVWEQSGRWDAMGDNLFRLRDRWGRRLCLAMTHEEVVATVAREMRSYRQLPQIWYQIQTKFRDEPRPKGGLMRVRQFTMKDSYSFDVDQDGLERSFEAHREAYGRIFSRCGLEFLAVEADSGAMGGSTSVEFMAPTEAGEDLVVVCRETGYAANLEKAVSRPVPPAVPDPDGDLAPEPFPTPGIKTIAEVSAFTGLPETSQIKSFVLMADGQPVMCLLRGDHQLSETKTVAALGAREMRPALPDEMRQSLGADAGSLGPVGVDGIRLVCDGALRGRRNMICGANRNDYHLKNVTPDEDFSAEWADIRQVAPGDTEAGTGAPLEILKAIEIGHIFQLGYRYSEALGLRVWNEAGQEVTPIMGSYGIGIERILTAAVELFHDADGMALPRAIAPFDVVITPVNWADAAQREAAEALYAEAKQRGLEPLLDDRDERPGVKFKDADLVGIPWRVTIGKKIARGVVEVVERRTKKVVETPVEDVFEQIRAD